MCPGGGEIVASVVVVLEVYTSSTAAAEHGEHRFTPMRFTMSCPSLSLYRNEGLGIV